MWVMGQLCDGSHGSWVTKDDPFPSLKRPDFNGSSDNDSADVTSEGRLSQIYGPTTGNGDG